MQVFTIGTFEVGTNFHHRKIFIMSVDTCCHVLLPVQISGGCYFILSFYGSSSSKGPGSKFPLFVSFQHCSYALVKINGNSIEIILGSSSDTMSAAFKETITIIRLSMERTKGCMKKKLASVHEKYKCTARSPNKD